MVYLQSSSAPGTFLSPLHYAAGAQPYALIGQDLNGDSRLDLAVASLGSPDGTVKSSLSVLLQSSAMPGTFLPATSYPADVRAWTIASGDLGVDGRTDLVVGNMGSFDGAACRSSSRIPRAQGVLSLP